MRYSMLWTLLAGVLLFFSGCSNTPYPGHEDTDDVIYYRAYTSPPKDLDPQRSYAQADGMLLFQCYESLFSYDYLKRPLELIPYLAKSVPEPQITKDADGKITEVRYSFELQEGVSFIDDPCFEGGKGREMTAKDFEFSFKRVGDPKTNCPVFDSFKHVMGFEAYSEKVKVLREAEEKRVAEAVKALGHATTGCVHHKLDDFRRIIDLNLIASFNINSIAAEHMAKNEPNEEGERGVMINTASIAAMDGQKDQAAYAASKGALNTLTLSLARTLAPHIRVNAVCPGFVDTGWHTKKTLGGTPLSMCFSCAE